jgi:hypothetical protein
MPDIFSDLEDVDSRAVLDYTSRDFTAIRAQLVGLAKGLMPDWETAGENSDFGTLIIELFAYMGDVMHFYIDRTASEAFLGTALRRQSVLYIADMLGYTPIGQQSASVDLEFSLDVNATDVVVLPVGTRIHNEVSDASDLVVFELSTNITLHPGDGSDDLTRPAIRGYAVEGITVPPTLLGTSQGTPNTEFVIADKGVVYGSVSITSREGPSVIKWGYITDLSLARPTQPVFTTFIDDAEFTHIIFGDNAVGRVPPVNAEIFASYRFGVGAEANSLAGDSLTTISLNNTASTSTEPVNMWGVYVTNPEPPVGGTDPESIDAMRYSIPRAAARLKSRAITLNDYADLALQVPGVAKSMAHGTVYTAVHVRIAPSEGNANDGLMIELCEGVERYMADKIIVGSQVYAEPSTAPSPPPPLTVWPSPLPIAGAAPRVLIVDQLWHYVYIRIMVHVQESYNRTTVRSAVDRVIRQMLAFDQVDFETRVAIGNIYRSALAVQGVEWVDLLWLDSTYPGQGAANDAARLVLEKSIWSVDDNRKIGDIVTEPVLIPKIDPFEVVETTTDFPGYTVDELTHDGLWVNATGGLQGT